MNQEVEMAPWLHKFWLEEEGQDLIEYSLLITFIAIACLALIGAGKPAVNGIWTQANSKLASGNSTASGS
jgi:Flp pilus assembly pilin Flp